MATTPATETYARIWAVVKAIPKGCVATYGQVAAEAGFHKQPRLAGYALNKLPERTRIPWHRVINAQGRLSFPIDSEAYLWQRQKLEAEGITFVGGRIDLARYRWRPRSAAPLLD